jgi:hypothetical protein
MYKIALVMLAVTINTCAPNCNDKAKHALQKYEAFVDSIYETNKTWKLIPDTEYVELSLHVHDFEKVRLDTFITPASSKKSMMFDAIHKVRIIELYIPLKVAVDLNYEQLDVVSRRRYQIAQKKFEVLLVE